MPHASLRGRRGPVKVTSEPSFLMSPGPMPRTSHSASILPNGPAESRLAMMRAARAGPMPGSDSIVADAARSRSTGPDNFACCETGAFAEREPRFSRGFSRTESSLESCRSSAAAAPFSDAGPTVRHIRTPLPDKATRARNHSAFRSLEVATSRNYIEIAGRDHPFDAGGARVTQWAWLATPIS